VNVNVFNGYVLLTGEVPDAAAKTQLETMVTALAPARLANETVIGPTSTLAERANDSQIAARVRARIVAESRNTEATHLLVVTERAVVYLLGISNEKVVDEAANAASRVAGVKQVVKMHESGQ
jgi:osmotically-inducible protein OsmY